VAIGTEVGVADVVSVPSDAPLEFDPYTAVETTCLVDAVQDELPGFVARRQKPW